MGRLLRNCSWVSFELQFLPYLQLTVRGPKGDTGEEGLPGPPVSARRKASCVFARIAMTVLKTVYPLSR